MAKRQLQRPTVRAIVALAALAGALLSGLGAGGGGGAPQQPAPLMAAEPRAASEFATALPRATRRLDRERREGRRALARSATPREQARAARQLQAAYQRAVDRLAALSADGEPTRRALPVMRRIARGYGQLAEAAVAVRRAAFGRATEAIERREKQLRRLLAAPGE